MSALTRAADATLTSTVLRLGQVLRAAGLDGGGRR